MSMYWWGVVELILRRECAVKKAAFAECDQTPEGFAEWS